MAEVSGGPGGGRGVGGAHAVGAHAAPQGASARRGVLATRSDRGVTRGPIAETLPGWRRGERWLVVTPHDDDPVIAIAMVLAAAAEIGAEVAVRIVTDGSMGYTGSVGPSDIVATRGAETRAAMATLGLGDVAWYGYPDAQLHLWQGRMWARDGGLLGADAPHIVAGATGLENSLVADLRALQPDRVLVAAGTDLHLDHKTVFHEVLMSLFHARGDIWPELGAPLAGLPVVYEFAAYSPFATAPEMQYEGTNEEFERKLAALAAFASQTQIASLVATMRAAGPIEHLRIVPTDAYDPRHYREMFRG